MKVSKFMLGLAAALTVGTNANAYIVIPTNQNGADTEVRESEITDNFGIVATTQRGKSTELATRGLDTTTTATNDRSSMMYMKFDISGLPNHNSDPAFWSNMNLFFRGYVRNTNLSNGRTLDQSRNSMALPVAEWERVKFNILGLEPGHVYADDPGGTTMRTDRSGQSYSSPNYKYNWDEGVGDGSTNGSIANNGVGTGISYLDAPGITPFCTSSGSCADAYGDTDPTNFRKTLGLYDDFNADTRLLGEWKWPIPKYAFNGTDRYPVGLPLEYTDSNGNLKQLIFDAQDAGRDKVTLIMHLAVNTLAEGNGGLFSTADFLNFNYLFIPKEMTTLTNDNNWDPDGSGPLGGIGSPYSCNGGDGTMGTTTNCNGDGTPVGDDVLRHLGDNSAGAFSPQLIVRVPEPASVALLALGSLVAVGIRRRK